MDSLSVLRSALDGVSDVEDELHVHGSLRHAGATSVDDGDQGAVQLVHVALREQPSCAAGLVLHLRAQTTFSRSYTPQRRAASAASYHIGLGGDAKAERVDAGGGEDGEVRSESAAGGHGDLLLKHAAGRENGRQAAVGSLELVEDLQEDGESEDP